MSWKPPIAGACCVVLGILLTACGGGGGGAESKNLELVIGDSLPLTGGLAALGPSGQKAADLAIDEINSSIEDTGADHSVNVVHEDNATDPATAEDVARKMNQQDRATCVTGPWDSESAVETARAVTVPSGVLQISPAASGNELTELDDQGLVVSMVPPPKSEGEALAKAIERDLGGAEDKTVNVAGRSDSYGDDLTQAFIEAWQGQGGTIGGLTIYSTEAPVETSSDSTSTTSEFDSSSSFDSSSTSFSSEASQITDGSPDAFVIADYSESFSGLASSLEGAGWDAETAWGSDGLSVPLPEEESFDAVEGMRAVVPGTPKDAEASTGFDDLFKSGDPKDVPQGRYAAQEFDATILCYLAAVKAGSTDGQKMADALVDITAPGGDEYTWQELSDAVEALENGDDINYVGASGPIDLNVDGDATAGVYDVYQYVDGVLDLSGEIPVESPEPPNNTDTDTTSD